MSEYPNFGKIAYDAYCKAVGGVSKFTGGRLPEFEAQDLDIKMAWLSAASAVVMVALELNDNYPEG